MRRFLSLLFIVFGIVESFSQIPTVQCSNVQISNRAPNSMTITWTNGNGNYGTLVVVKPAANATSSPVNGLASPYSANTNYGSGSNLGNSNYCVYFGTGTSVTVSNLTPNTQYTAFAYSCSQVLFFPAYHYYYNTSATAANMENGTTLVTEPTTQVTNLTTNSISYTTANVTFTGGNGTYALVNCKKVVFGSVGYPVDGTSYVASTNMGSGTNMATSPDSVHTVYASTGSSFTLTNLKPATTYRLRAFEYNFGQATSQNYLLTSIPVHDFTTLNYPPTINAISNATWCVSPGQKSVALSGISDGSPAENQTISISATSSNQTLIPNGNISISYTSPNTTGTLYYTPATGVTGTATITVTVNDNFSTTNTTSVQFVVTVNGPPANAGTITPSGLVGGNRACKDGTTTYTFTVPSISNATGYVWSFPTNTQIVSGSNTNSIQVRFPATVTASAYTVSVYGTNGFGCGNGVASTYPILLDLVPTTSNAGPDQTVCTSTAQLAGNTPSIGTGTWTQLSGPVATITNANLPNTTIGNLINGVGNAVTLQWRIANGGCLGTPDQVIITYDLSAPVCLVNADFFANNTNPCTGSQITFTDNSVGATSWNWNFGTGATPPTATGAGPHNVTYSSTGQKTVTLSINGPNGPDVETKSNYIDVISTPSAAGAISGTSPVCQGTTQVLYSVGTIGGATSYNWVLPSGAVINTGNGTNAISVNFGASAVSGNITVNGVNACGSGTSSSYSVTVNPLPGGPGPISGNVTVCQGQTGVTYSVSPSSNASSYNWVVPPGASIVSGSNTNSITVDFSPTAISDTIEVYGTNACGDGPKKIQFVTVNPLPGAASGITGPSNLTLCPASTGIVFSVPAIANATNYNWTVPSGGNIVSGSNTNSITVDFNNSSVSGNVSVFASNGCGNGSSTNYAVTFPALPSIDLCVASVDSASQHNEIFWDKPVSNEISSFRIYRKITAVLDALVGDVAYSDPSYLLDTLAGGDPNTNPYEYRISVVDTCGNEGPKSSYHETMFLQTSLGTGNSINLSWNPYVGQTPNFYMIYRDTAGLGNWELLNGTVPPGTTVYTDVNPPQNTSYLNYRVEVDWLTSCVPTRAPINTTRSNIKNAKLSSIQELPSYLLEIYPNPANDVFTLNLKSDMGVVKMVMYNNLGQEVKSEILPAGTRKHTIDASELNAGLYFIQLISNDKKITKRMIIE